MINSYRLIFQSLFFFSVVLLQGFLNQVSSTSWLAVCSCTNCSSSSSCEHAGEGSCKCPQAICRPICKGRAPKYAYTLRHTFLIECRNERKGTKWRVCPLAGFPLLLSLLDSCHSNHTCDEIKLYKLYHNMVWCSQDFDANQLDIGLLSGNERS